MSGLKDFKVVNIGDLADKPTEGIIEMSYADWLLKGTELFGPNMMKWRFVCPSCGNIQTVEEFRAYKDKGAEPNDAYFNCIGRFDGHGDVPMCSGQSPCNYTTGGLFCISPVKVKTKDKDMFIFAFDEPKPKG